MLVDCDPLGGGLDLVLGAEDLGGLRWPGLDVGGGRVPATALHAALPAPTVDGGGELAVGDLNGDHIDDVVAVHDGSGQPIWISIFLGASTGALRPASPESSSASSSTESSSSSVRSPALP